MPLYCYIIETGCYDDKEANILGHATKYSQEEFDNICMEIIKKHGKVDDEAYTSHLTLEEVEEVHYHINPQILIKYLVNEYDFIELDPPVNDGNIVREVSREPCNPENIRRVEFKGRACPNGKVSDVEIVDITMEPDFKKLPLPQDLSELIVNLPPIDLSSGYDDERKNVIKTIFERIADAPYGPYYNHPRKYK